MNFEGVRVLVVGLGRSGQAAVELLRARGARVRATDLKQPSPAVLDKLRAGGVEFLLQSPEAFRGVEWIVLSPGVPADLPELLEARARGVRVIGEVELGGYYLLGPVLGITGSNGKTTTTALAGHILRQCGIPAQVGGNIGLPVCAMVASSRSAQWNVLELSSFQLETIERFRARLAVGLNVTADHLDRHKSFANYAAQKARLFQTQTAEDFAVLNRDDPVCASWAAVTRAQVRWFSLRGLAPEGACLREGQLWLEGRPFMAAAEIPLRGMHNVENVLAAALATRLAGAPPEGIREAVRSFPGVEHRLEFV
ncbi:MAG: UDP-N-acetylmuramoyl-L-alanine--D-glutamate ligase, partial [Bryobacteraceae bacterium]